MIGFMGISAQAQHRYNQRQTNKLRNLGENYRKRGKLKRAEALRKAKSMGLTIRETYKGRTMELQGFSKSKYSIPLYFTNFNTVAAQSISTDKVHTELGLTGNSITLGIWDGGRVRTSHQEFGNRVIQQDGAVSLSDHATHVAGTMMASGVNANAKGMAPGASLFAYDWNDDLAEMTEAAANGLLLSNHSYGFITGWRWHWWFGWIWYGDISISATEDYKFGFYNDYARDVDNIAFNAPYYLICKAAGNDRSDVGTTGAHWIFGSNGLERSTDLRNPDGDYDCISGSGVSKNVLTVGAVNDLPNGYTQAADVVQTRFSGWGPTDDGRIKPDLVANGAGLLSSTSGADDAYGSSSGTSMSTPSVTGSLGLLQEHYHNLNNSYMKAATLKALAIHTADEAGDAPGPDYANGWGLMNTKTAADVITNRNVSAKIEEATLDNESTYTIHVNATGNEPLVATIVWTDHAGNPVAPALDPDNRMLVNDLDMRITRGSNSYSPWILDPANPSFAATTGDNDRDNVEQVLVANASKGAYTITITHKGQLQAGSQNFSIIVTGISNIPVCLVPEALNVAMANNTTANVSWNAVNGSQSYNVRYRVQGIANWAVINNVTGTSVSIADLARGAAYEVQVQANCAEGGSDFSASTVFTSAVSYCDATGNNASREYIKNVRIGKINKTSASNGGYADFTNLSTNLSRENSTSITISPAWVGNANEAYKSYAVFIDFNQDGDFNDAGEKAFTHQPTPNPNTTGTIRVPNSALLGKTRMRVIMKVGQVPGACGTFAKGEVEDYTVNIVPRNYNFGSQAIEPTLPVDVLIAPNPATGYVNVQTSAQNDTQVKFVLTNLNGKVLQTTATTAQGSRASQTFNVSMYPKGIYLVKIITSNGAQTVKRLVVN
ncbi:hypothetical protein BKI52_07325 [marine bacterium AO1-C]|nr:hypothetical protein BKI52_07325 [marine bacterium AO1-C]